MDVIRGKTQDLRRHLCKYSVGTLPDFCGAGLELDTPVLIEDKPGSGYFQGNGPYTGLIAEQSHAHTAPDIPGLVLV